MSILIFNKANSAASCFTMKLQKKNAILKTFPIRKIGIASLRLLQSNNTGDF